MLSNSARADEALQNAATARSPRVVAIGGGTGLPNVLRGCGRALRLW